MHTCMNSDIKTSSPHYHIDHRQRGNDIHSFIQSGYFYSASLCLLDYYSEALLTTVIDSVGVYTTKRYRQPYNTIHTIQYIQYNIHGVSEKNCAKLFLSELRQLFINFNDFGDLDEKMAEILCYIYIFHLTSLTLSHSLVKYKSTKFYSFSGKL